MILENAVENHFTAKTPRAQRTYNRDKIHPIGEDQEHTRFHSNPCFSLAYLRLCGGSFIPTAFFRIKDSTQIQVINGFTKRAKRGNLLFAVLDLQPRPAHAATAVPRTRSSTATNLSTCFDVNSPSGPLGVRSVNGDSYNNAASMTPCSVR